jgi:hypothetical protein
MTRSSFLVTTKGQYLLEDWLSKFFTGSDNSMTLRSVSCDGSELLDVYLSGPFYSTPQLMKALEKPPTFLRNLCVSVNPFSSTGIGLELILDCADEMLGQMIQAWEVSSTFS